MRNTWGKGGSIIPHKCLFIGSPLSFSPSVNQLEKLGHLSFSASSSLGFVDCDSMVSTYLCSSIASTSSKPVVRSGVLLQFRKHEPQNGSTGALLYRMDMPELFHHSDIQGGRFSR